MRQQQAFVVCIILPLLLAALAACSPGHTGGNEIAFVRDGQLWTMDPDGANAFAIVGNNPPVLGYGWSPTHQILTFRTIDSTFATTTAGKHLAINPLTGSVGDVPATLNTVGIDGGVPIPILLSSQDAQYSNAWWNPGGNRLLYREAYYGDHNPNTMQWWIAQDDQPEGIARKSLPNSFSIPSLSSNNSLAIGNSSAGVFTTTIAGTTIHYLSHTSLTGHPLPATLERVLWQPDHANPLFLYAIENASPSTSTGGKQQLTVQLVISNVNGQKTIITSCHCEQFAWSPDGNSILYSTGSSYTIYNMQKGTSFSITGESGSVPYWSPDSHFLLLDGLHSLTLINLASQQQQVLLSDGTPPASTNSSSASQLTVNVLVQPVSNSIWSADGRHFLFLTRGRLLWQGKALSAGKGLYTVSINDNGQPQGSPTKVDTGNDTQAGWTYEDPNTSFLF
ncbi:MAG TPA: hypothetical protein VKU38_14105 [Ktedonobacteraceae bacterium]|nr:hypothetical protein [Ktedonobacteraceae bacterium]